MPRKNPDYTKSAVKLVNPPEVSEALVALGELELRLEDEKQVLANQAKDQLAVVAKLDAEVAEAKSALRGLIKEKGSYQDIDAGIYGVLYTQEKHAWDLQLVKDLLPKYAEAAIQESVNHEVMKGLVQGGLVKKELMPRLFPVVSTVNSFIIRAVGKPAEVPDAD